MPFRRWPPHPIVWITALSLVWVALLALNVIPQLRGDYGWRWPFEPVLDLRRTGPLIVGVALYVPVALALQRRRSARPLLLWSLAGCAGLALAAAHLREDVPFRLFTVTAAGGPGGWHLAAARISDLTATLAGWPQFMAEAASFSSHMGISPPGMVTIYYIAGALLARIPGLASSLAGPLRLLQCQDFALMRETDAQLASAWVGMLMPLWASLTILPLYHLGRRAFGEQPARWSVLWWPLVPSFLIFTPLPNTIYPLPAILMILLLYEGLRRNRPGLVLVSGLLMSFLTFVTFTFAPLLLLAGFLTLGMYWLGTRQPAERHHWTWPLQMGFWYGLGLSVVWLLVYLASGLLPWDVLRAATQAHLDLDRPYWPWLFLHLYDFFMFTGWPLALLAGVGVWSVLRRRAGGQPATHSDVMTLSAVLALVILDLSGTLRGESGRILLFLSPWLLLAAAQALHGRRRLAQVTTVTQALITVVMIVCLRVLDSGAVPPPAAPPAPAIALPAATRVVPNGAVFGEVARLNAFASKIEARPGTGATLLLWLDWKSIGQVDVPYYLAVLPIAPDGEVASAASVQQPFRGEYPTTCWPLARGTLQDQIEVPLFKESPGDWWVSLRLIDGQTGQPETVINPDGSQDTQVGLGPLR